VLGSFGCLFGGEGLGSTKFATLKRIAVWLSRVHHWCMKAYSEDLRAKILQAVDRGMPKSEAARAFGVSRSSVKRYAAARREGRPLAPKKHPGSEPKLDERARKLLEADVEDRPATTLKDRCRFLEEMVGVSVSESTLSRVLRKMGFSPKDGAWVRARGTSS